MRKKEGERERKIKKPIKRGDGREKKMGGAESLVSEDHPQQPICLSSVKLFLIKNIFRRLTIFFAADFVGGGKLRKTLFGASFVHFFRIQKKLYCPFVSLAAAAATAARSVGSPI